MYVCVYRGDQLIGWSLTLEDEDFTQEPSLTIFPYYNYKSACACTCERGREGEREFVCVYVCVCVCA